MSTTDKTLSEKESLDLIAKMINQAKNAYHDTGVAAMMWGAVVAVCALVKLSEIQFNYRLPFDIYLLTLVAIIPQVFISIREKKKRKVKTYDDIYMDGDYDYDRYDRDSDYADGVDDAMDEYGEDW